MSATPVWTPEPFEADDGTIPFERFVDNLSELKFAAVDAAIRRVLAVRGLDLVRTEWLKPLGDGLHEFRIRHNAEEIARMFGGEASGTRRRMEPVLLRVFVHFYGSKVVLLLGGYDKGAAPKPKRQQRAIAEARRLLAQFKDRQRRERVRNRVGERRSRRATLTFYGEVPIMS